VLARIGVKRIEVVTTVRRDRSRHVRHCGPLRASAVLSPDLSHR
jgi:hypothetical protein